MLDALVVGAGFSGCVMAERLASSGRSVLVIDRRAHIGGNAYDELDEYGVLVHRHGPHVFHTNSQEVSSYLSRFTEWRPYEHRTLAMVDGKLYPFPINQTTINQLYNLNLDEQGVRDFLARVRIDKPEIRTSEDFVLSRVGSDLCEKFYRGYTRKQWGLDLSELSSSVAGRIPVRVDIDDRYFTNSFQAMPREGYTAMFKAMLQHPNICVELGTDFSSIKSGWKRLIWTGAIDEYFNLRLGQLPYRSLRFEFEYRGVPRYQSAATINYPNDGEATRVTEFKYLTGQQHQGTTIAREYPSAVGEPYYPVPRPENAVLYQQYRALADAQKRVTFVGRLARYRYCNMDQAVAAALVEAKELVG